MQARHELNKIAPELALKVPAGHATGAALAVFGQ